MDFARYMLASRSRRDLITGLRSQTAWVRRISIACSKAFIGTRASHRPKSSSVGPCSSSVSWPRAACASDCASAASAFECERKWGDDGEVEQHRGWLALALACVYGCQRAPREVQTDRAPATAEAAPEVVPPEPEPVRQKVAAEPAAVKQAAAPEPAHAASPEAPPLEAKHAPARARAADGAGAHARKSSGLAKLATAQRTLPDARDVSEANAAAGAEPPVTDFGGRR